MHTVQQDDVLHPDEITLQHERAKPRRGFWGTGDADRLEIEASWPAALALVAAFAAQPAFAQQTPSPAREPQGPQAASEPASGQVSYPAAFFAQYNPVSAADMVARVPGFELREGDDRRGFGATAGNVLVNGERPSSKTTPSEILKRIPASSVLRIEVLSGTDAAVDVRGQSQIVNVVLERAARRDSSTNYVLGLRYIQYSNRLAWVSQLSRTLSLSPDADLSIDVQAPNLLGRSQSYDTLLTSTGDVTGSRVQYGKPNNMGLQGAAALRWRATPQDTVNLNVQYAPTWNSTAISQYETAATGALRNTLAGDTQYRNNYTAEGGGDWEHRFSPAVSLKLIGLISEGSVDQQDRFDIFSAPATTIERTQDRATRNGERIGRARLKWTPTAAHTLEFGAEGAFNFRDTTLDIVSRTNGGPPVPTPLAVADARVEELRGEAFAADIWTVSPKLTLEFGFNYEVSRITQTGDQQKERNFQYPKPRASATYAFDPRHILRASVVRDVAQLDFAEFSSAVDFVNTTSIQGNPNLKPETAWKLRVEWEGRFAARSALTVALFSDFVQDVHDLIDIAGFDAYGNIGDGRRTGVELRASTPLAAIGLPNAELRFIGIYQQTRVTDPITGRRRSFSVPLERQGTPPGSPTLNAGNKDWAYVLNFRQNLPKISASAGFAVVQWSDRSEYRRAEMTEYRRDKPRVDLFFETTAIKPVTVRVTLNNLLPADEARTRTFFVGARAAGVVQRSELRRVLGGPEGSRSFGVQVSGRF